MLAAAIAPLAAGCSGDDPPGPTGTVVGTWEATSLTVFGQNLIAQGMTLTATFRANDTYTIDVTGDLTGQCDPGPDCTVSGSYAATGSQLTLDEGTATEVTFAYVIQGSTMTLNGSIEGIPAVVSLRRV